MAESLTNVCGCERSVSASSLVTACATPHVSSAASPKVLNPRCSFIGVLECNDASRMPIVRPSLCALANFAPRTFRLRFRGRRAQPRYPLTDASFSPDEHRRLVVVEPLQLPSNEDVEL